MCENSTAEVLGFDDDIPPYASASDDAILKGVNFASAAGIREETGWQLGGHTTSSGQVNNYQETVSRVVNLLGTEDQAASYLGKCICPIRLGSNDIQLVVSIHQKPLLMFLLKIILNNFELYTIMEQGK
ncbi:unnamed protein product [Lathyrus sativus]|nr:unnamed protein product [Lathyrus sativus]